MSAGRKVSPTKLKKKKAKGAPRPNQGQDQGKLASSVAQGQPAARVSQSRPAGAANPSKGRRAGPGHSNRSNRIQKRSRSAAGPRPGMMPPRIMPGHFQGHRGNGAMRPNGPTSWSALPPPPPPMRPHTSAPSRPVWNAGVNTLSSLAWYLVCRFTVFACSFAT